MTPDDSASRSRSSHETKLIKRVQVAAACAECRLRKAKCDAARPTCGRCEARELVCYYGVEPGTTRAVAHKRKHIELQDRYDGLLELHRYLRTKTEPEAMEILRRIRETEDPFAVVRLIREGDILLQRRLSTPQMSAALKRFDNDALQSSSIKVSSRPWTVVAGDGIVSYLISQYFNREQRFCMPFIHPKAFLSDMAQGDPATAVFCSPLLVNAICAFGAFGSKYLDSIDAANGGKLREQFHAEAKKLFDREAGRASLTNVQALFFLYMYSTSAATDRAGLVYRLAGCEMFTRLSLGSRIPPKPGKYDEQLYAAAISRNAWGLFFIESLIAFVYLQTPLMTIPTISPLPFERSKAHSCPESRLFDTDDVLNFLCDGAKICYSIASNCLSVPDAAGFHADVEKRKSLYNSLNRWGNSLPPVARFAADQHRQWYFLRCHYHFGAIAVWRPLQHIGTILPGTSGTPTEMCISHCKALMGELSECRKVSSSNFSQGSIETLFYHYVCSVTVFLSVTREPEGHSALVQCCRYFHDVAPYWPAANANLFGIQALAKEMHKDIPPEAMQFLPRTSAVDAANNDIPISWAIPRHDDLVELFSADGFNTKQMSVELGTVISKWAALSI